MPAFSPPLPSLLGLPMSLSLHSSLEHRQEEGVVVFFFFKDELHSLLSSFKQNLDVS